MALPSRPRSVRAPLGIRLSRPLELLRNTLRVRIEEALPGDNGHIAAALIMGDQGGISEKTQDAMRASGLGHVLSISGLHMAHGGRLGVLADPRAAGAVARVSR